MKVLSKYDDRNPPKKIRLKLDDLCNGEYHPFDHPTRYWSVFFPEFESNLDVVKPPPGRGAQYNCYAFALGLNYWVHRIVIFKAIVNEDLDKISVPEENDIVVYRSSEFDSSNHLSIRHAGLITLDGKVNSKWAGGAVFKHEVFFSPMGYGNQVEFYNSVMQDQAGEIIRKYKEFNRQTE